MSDQFHQSLSAIVMILKSSPSSITIQNIQRLSNIYKFETFIESIDDKLHRLSIAGKILVIDLDYEELKSSLKDQTYFHIKDVKLVLANNNNNFNYHNSKSNENILKNSLNNYKKLGSFDKNLEKLFIFDQFTTNSFDLYSYYIQIYDRLVSKFGSNNVELNYDDQFNIKLQDNYLITLVNDDGANLKWIDNENLINNEVGISVTVINGSRPIPKNYLLINQIKSEKDVESITLFNPNDIFKSNIPNSNLKLQGFQFLESEITSIKSFIEGDFNKVLDVISKLELYGTLIDFITSLKNYFKIDDKVLDVDEEEDLFQQFLNEKDNEMDVEANKINVTISDDYVELTSTLSSFNGKFELKNEEQFITGLKQLEKKFPTELK